MIPLLFESPTPEFFYIDLNHRNVHTRVCMYPQTVNIVLISMNTTTST